MDIKLKSIKNHDLQIKCKKKLYNEPSIKEIGKIDKITKGGATREAFDSGFENLVS